MTPRELYIHINSVHLDCRQHISPGFLTHYRHAVCHNCAVLIAAGKPCPACLNRERKTIRPADLLISHWSREQDAAIDSTVVHSINPSNAWDLHHTTVDKAEEVMHLKFGAT